MTSGLLHVDQVERTYGGAAPVHALRQATFEVAPGDFVAITGASGSGKSTLLNVLGLLDHPTSGNYFVDGVDTTSLTESQRTFLRGTHFGFVFQAFHLLADRSVIDNVGLSMLYQAIPRANRTERALDAIERVGLGHRTHAMPTTLSGGERQRVAVARALAARPQVLLCDEPTGNLDRETSDQILDLLTELNNDGLTVLVVTHDDDVASRARHTITVSDGVVTP